MVTSRKSNISDDDGNLGDDEKEQYELENHSRKRKRRINSQACNSRKRRKKMKIVHCSSDEELFSSNKQKSSPMIFPEGKDVYSTHATANVKEMVFYQPNETTNTVCCRFNEALSITTLSSSHESILPASLDVTDHYRKNESPPIKCLNCKLKPRNSLLIHKRPVGHQVLCYSCAQIWWRSNKRCPICNRKILQIEQINPL